MRVEPYGESGAIIVLENGREITRFRHLTDCPFTPNSGCIFPDEQKEVAGILEDGLLELIQPIHR